MHLQLTLSRAALRRALKGFEPCAPLHAGLSQAGLVWSRQVLRVYANGKLVARTDEPGAAIVYNITGLPITGGTNYIFVLDGTLGDPYGNYRGHPGLR